LLYSLLDECDSLLRLSSLELFPDRLPGLGIPDPGAGIPDDDRLLLDTLFLVLLDDRFLLLPDKLAIFELFLAATGLSCELIGLFLSPLLGSVGGFELVGEVLVLVPLELFGAGMPRRAGSSL
jgi:hypothetical protein